MSTLDSIETKVKGLLLELLDVSKAQRVRLIPASQTIPERAHYATLGYGTILVAEFSRKEPNRAIQSRQELVERSSRSIRACLKGHGCTRIPLLSVPCATVDLNSMILSKARQFLRGLVDTSNLYQMTLLHHGQHIASAYPINELDESRLHLLSRQLNLAAQRNVGSSHGELVQNDIYARTFWYGGALIGFSTNDYSLDFIRHRTKMVARELTHLLSMLEDDPDRPPTMIAPIPDL